LHSILYDLLVKGETAQAVEIKIQKQIEKQLREIVDKDTSVKILKKYNKEQTFSDINFSKLQNDLVKEKDNLISLLDEHDYRIEDYERTKKQRNYPHKRTYILYAAEKGKIAVWLADDIKRFMPKDFKEQWKGYQHSELQKLLAYYDTNHKLIAELLKGIDIENLPFDLNNCLKKNTLEDFYPMYLEKRIGYISQLIEQIKNFKAEPKLLKKVLNECFKFLKEKNYKQCELNEQVQRLLAMPVFIERGFLDEKPTMKPNILFDDNKEDFAEWFVYYKSNNNYQKFYDVDLYPLLYNDKKEFYRLQTKIKRQQKNDFFTLLMAKELFTEIFREEANFTLGELFQSREERLKNAENAKETQERNLNFIWNKVVNLNLANGKINISDVKLKDIGNFKAFETDKRVISFLEYESDKQWLAYLPNNVSKENIALDVIECQLQNYEKVRAHQLFKEVQKLEEYIYHKVENKEVLKQDGNQNFKNYLLYGLYNRDLSQEFTVIKNENFEKISIKEIREKAKKLEQQLFILTYIRNKFAHNQMPKKEFYDFCHEIAPCENMNQFYADYYLMVFSSIVNELSIN
ncbi:MAG: type VI-B CRISPR-associated RNA-guided ribonuclease Cas13b, partial [Myroides sp.]|nr:type VI-B CRISPR-associated RNA-guided ribonuclease Cas13b [Myroides sp.]